MSKIIAVDFDGTLVENKYPLIGEPNEPVIEALKKEIDNGAEVILWTCRTKKQLAEALEFCKSYKIKLSEVNNNLSRVIESIHCNPRKIIADEYWDDRAVKQAYTEPTETKLLPLEEINHEIPC